MTDELTIEYWPLDELKRWDRNPKRHDIGAIVESIRRYGMIDPPKIDRTLGALVYGNGRAEALQWMQAQGDAAPRGVKVAEDGCWLAPVKVGIDAASVAEAEAAALDHNNLTMSGGDYTAWDMARLWDQAAYTELLAGLATADALPITVDGDALDALLQRAGDAIDPGDLWKGMPDFEQDDLESWKSIKVHFANEDDYHAFARLVNQTLTPQTKYIWYPPRPHENRQAHRWADEP